jgi:hypothetical protein
MWTQKADIIVPNPEYASGFAMAGYGFVNTFSNSNFGMYDPITDNWIMAANLSFPRGQAVGFAIGNKGYVGTGQDGNGRRSDVWKFTPCLNFPTATVNINGPTEFCSGDSVILTASSGLSYVWWNGETTQSIVVKIGGMYAVIVTTDCGVVTSDPVNVTVYPSPPVPTITQYDSLLISGSSTYNQWYFNGTLLPGDTGQNLVATQLGTYSVVVTDSNGCSNSDSYVYTGNPNFTSVPICMVTVDSNSQYNVIVWDKTLVTNVDTFVVYREISSNNYQPIARIPYNALSQFVDTVHYTYFPNTGDPNTGTYRYKMQCIDSYGLASSYSSYHNTIYFVNNGGIFTWLQPYEIENEGNPVTSYILMRDDLSDGNWHDVGSVAGTQNFITDPDYNTYLSTASWRVRTSWAITCSPSFKTDKLISTSFSNVYRYSGIGLDETGQDSQLVIYPNPFNETLQIRSGILFDHAILEIYNYTGQRVFSAPNISGKDLTIDQIDLPDGVYLLKILNGERTISKRIIKATE